MREFTEEFLSRVDKAKEFITTLESNIEMGINYNHLVTKYSDYKVVKDKVYTLYDVYSDENIKLKSFKSVIDLFCYLIKEIL